MNNQLHISKTTVETLEQLANYKINIYQHLLNFAQDIAVDRIHHRVHQLYQIHTLLDEKKIIDFEKFDDLENYILEKRNYFILASAGLDKIHLEEYKDTIDELFTKYVPKLTGSNRDKVNSMLYCYIEPTEKTWRREKNYQCYNNYGFRKVLEDLITWYKNIAIFKFFDIDLEKFRTMDDLYYASNGLQAYKRAHDFYKELKPELQKTIINKIDFYNKVSELKNKTSFYKGVIEQSHKYEDYNQFHKDLKKLELTHKLKDIFNIIEHEKIRVVHYDTDNYVLIAHIETFQQIQKIGTTNWCLTNRNSDWHTYTHDKHFVIYWTFNDSTYLENTMYGICLNKKTYEIENIQNKNNSTAHNFSFTPIEQKAIKDHFNSLKTNNLNIQSLKTVKVNNTNEVAILDEEEKEKQNLFRRILSRK